MTTPTGIGLYLRALTQKRHKSPAAAAKKAKDHGVSFVALMTAWQDIKKGTGKPYMLHSNGRDAKAIIDYANAFKKQGIDVWLWGFPRAGGEDEYIERFARVTAACCGTITGWLHDPEVYYKWNKAGGKLATLSMRGQPEFSKDATPISTKSAWVKSRAGVLIQFSALEGFHGPEKLGITSYGMAPGHKTFPWREFGGHGWGSPQLYSVGPKDVDRGIQAWRNHGWQHIIPSVPLFGKNSGSKLHDHLSNFVDGNEAIDGFIFWSWCQGTQDEWKVIARWSDWLARGACTL